MKRVNGRNLFAVVFAVGGSCMSALAINKILFARNHQFAIKDNRLVPFRDKLQKTRERRFRRNKDNSGGKTNQLTNVELKKLDLMKIMVNGADIVSEIVEKIERSSHDVVISYMKNLMRFESDLWDKKTHSDSMKECIFLLQNNPKLLQIVKRSLQEEQRERVDEFMTKMDSAEQNPSDDSKFASFIEEILHFKGGDFSSMEPDLNQKVISGQLQSDVLRYMAQLLKYNPTFWDKRGDDVSSRNCALYLEMNPEALEKLLKNMSESDQPKVEQFLEKMNESYGTKEQAQKLDWEKQLKFQFLKTRSLFSQEGIADYLRDDVLRYMMELMNSDPGSWDTIGDDASNINCALHFELNQKDLKTLQQDLNDSDQPKIEEFMRRMDESCGTKEEARKIRSVKKGIPEFCQSIDSWTGLGYPDWERDISRLTKVAKKMLPSVKETQEDVFRYMKHLLHYDSAYWNTKGDDLSNTRCFVHFKMYPHDLMSLQQSLDEAGQLKIAKFMEQNKEAHRSNDKVQNILNSEKYRRVRLAKYMVLLGMNPERLAHVHDLIEKDPHQVVEQLDSQT